MLRRTPTPKALPQYAHPVFSDWKMLLQVPLTPQTAKRVLPTNLPPFIPPALSGAIIPSTLRSDARPGCKLNACRCGVVPLILDISAVWLEDGLIGTCHRNGTLSRVAKMQERAVQPQSPRYRRPNGARWPSRTQLLAVSKPFYLYALEEATRVLTFESYFQVLYLTQGVSLFESQMYIRASRMSPFAHFKTM